ncbi:hypothetical protein ACX93W_05145 [Paenibacillus sp. CAU 1782]
MIKEYREKLNKVFFIVLSKGMGNVGHEDDVLHMINTPLLSLSEKLPFSKTIFATVAFNIIAREYNDFHLKIINPDGKTIQIVDLNEYVMAPLQNAPKAENENEGIALMGVIGVKLGEVVEFETTGEYNFVVYYNDEPIGISSLFIDDGGSDMYE